MQTKICTKCGIEKELIEFSNHPTSKFGKHPACNFCRNEINKIYRKKNKEKFSEVDLRYKNKYPWRRIWNYINQRCNNINCKGYSEYGSKGIKNLFKNWDEIKYLWVRDNAHLLERPSIDRIDDNGNYCIENCRFIEFIDNARRTAIKQRKPILQYDLKNNFIAEYESVSQAAIVNSLGFSSISHCARGEMKTAYNFIWKFKK